MMTTSELRALPLFAELADSDLEYLARNVAEAIDVVDRATGARSRRSTTALFAFIGADTDTGWLPQEIARDERGFLLAGSDIVRAGRWALDRDPYLVETSAPGVFAVGDIRAGSVKRVASGVGEGHRVRASVAPAGLSQMWRPSRPQRRWPGCHIRLHPTQG